ncbi:MAG: iron chelate uptake ABC transporter family permease subunit [Bacteroidota bacterium]
MDAIIEVLQQAWAIRALLASAMVGVMCGVLGCFIILRNMALIGDALSHAILPGVVAGFLIAGFSVLGFFAGSVVAGLLAAILITWIQRNVKTQEDAAIGIVFTSMFAVGVMGISWLTRQEGVHLDLKDFLFGNVLGISDQDLWMTGMVMLFSLICVLAFYRYFFMTTFESVVAQTIGISVSTMHYFLMLLLSFAVVASLQSVGVILVVAMLITPASTAYLLTYRLPSMLILAALAGLISTTLGLLIAIIFETTPGPAMTITATGLYVLAVLFAPRRGLVSKAMVRRQKRNRIRREDILKQSVRLEEQQRLSWDNLGEKLDILPARVRWISRALERKGLLKIEAHAPRLSEAGRNYGYRLIRAHRLWETYLVQEVGLAEDQIHDHAEDFEHILPEELIQEVSQKLGHPDRDPHGSPIPHARDGVHPNLAEGDPARPWRISADQPNYLVRSDLWERGLQAGMVLRRIGAENGLIQYTSGENRVELPQALAQRIKVETPDPAEIAP